MFYKTVLILVLLFLAWIAYRLILRRVESNRQRSAFNLVFEKFDGTKPNLTISSSYSYPSFKLIFKTKEDMDKAQMEGLIKQFTVKIQEICQLPSDAGREAWSFDAERAIYATYEGKS
jgi:hypothetical protein